MQESDVHIARYGCVIQDSDARGPDRREGGMVQDQDTLRREIRYSMFRNARLRPVQTLT